MEKLDLTTILPDVNAEMPAYKVSVKEAPVQGRANEAIVRALAKHFDTPPAPGRLVFGQTSKQKILDIFF